VRGRETGGTSELRSQRTPEDDSGDLLVLCACGVFISTFDVLKVMPQLTSGMLGSLEVES
jgi:hypothetical protein